MPNHERAAISGRVTDIFAHRFVIEAADGRRVLADLGPQGVELVPLRVGLAIDAEGEQKPSELKVHRVAVAGGTPIVVPYKPKLHKHKPHKPEPHHGPAPHEAAKPEIALKAVRAAGYEPLGTPRRRPKHFEVLARRDRGYLECHVELDGHIRKEKPVSPHDEKWADDIKSAA